MFVTLITCGGPAMPEIVVVRPATSRVPRIWSPVGAGGKVAKRAKPPNRPMFATGTVSATPAAGTFTTMTATTVASASFSDSAGVYTFAGQTAQEAEIRLGEDADNGSNYVGLKAPAALAGNQVWVLPSADGNANEVLQTDGSGNLTFAAAAAGGTSRAFAVAMGG